VFILCFPSLRVSTGFNVFSFISWFYMFPFICGFTCFPSLLCLRVSITGLNVFCFPSFHGFKHNFSLCVSFVFLHFMVFTCFPSLLCLRVSFTGLNIFVCLSLFSNKIVFTCFPSLRCFPSYFGLNGFPSHVMPIFQILRTLDKARVEEFFISLV
jgi:hypothetical protein